MLGLKSFRSAAITLAGIEIMHMIKKGQMIYEELLRIVQEALTNTLKHASASKFEVKLLFDGYGLQLEICDDGIGFDPTRQYEGFGLMGMSERAKRIGGKLTLLSLSGKGTEIRVALMPVQTGTEAA